MDIPKFVKIMTSLFLYTQLSEKQFRSFPIYHIIFLYLLLNLAVSYRECSHTDNFGSGDRVCVIQRFLYVYFHLETRRSTIHVSRMADQRV